MRIHPRGCDVMPVDEQLTPTGQLSLHDHGQHPQGFGDLIGAHAVDEEVHKQQMRLLRVDPLDLPLRMAPGQRTALKELDVPGAVTRVLNNASHMIGVVAKDPDRLVVRNWGKR